MGANGRHVETYLVLPYSAENTSKLYSSVSIRLCIIDFNNFLALSMQHGLDKMADIFRRRFQITKSYILLNEKYLVLIKISLKLVSEDLADNVDQHQ